MAQRRLAQYCPWLAAAALVVALAACTDGQPAAGVQGAKCPCQPGLACDPAKQVCVAPSNLAQADLTLTLVPACDGVVVPPPDRAELTWRDPATGLQWQQSQQLGATGKPWSASIAAVAGAGGMDLTVQGFAGNSPTPTWHGRAKTVQLAKTAKTALQLALYPLGALACPAGGQLSGARLFPAAAALPDGKVVVAGGLTHAALDGNSLAYDSPSAEVQVFSARLGAFVQAGALGSGRAGAAMAWLPQANKVLVVGGVAAMVQPADASGPPAWSGAADGGYELVDLASKTSAAGDMAGLPMRAWAFGHLLPLYGGAVAAVAGAPWPPFAKVGEGEAETFAPTGVWQRLAGDCNAAAPINTLGDERGAAAMAAVGSPASARMLLWGGDVTGGVAPDAATVFKWQPQQTGLWTPSQRAPISQFANLVTDVPLGDLAGAPTALLFSALARAPKNGSASQRYLAVGGAKLAPATLDESGKVVAAAWQAPMANAAWLLNFTEPTQTQPGRMTGVAVAATDTALVFHQLTAAGEHAVVLSGGLAAFGGAATGKLRVFDNETGQFSATGDKAPNFAARAGHVAIALENDCILFFGGAAGLSAEAMNAKDGPRGEVYCPSQVAAIDTAVPAKPVAKQPADLKAIPPPLQMDVLFVVDHSSSMCQEQRWLAKGAAAFAQSLAAQAQAQLGATLDLQAAVVTVQQIADANQIKKIGQFVHAPALSLPPSCIEKVKFPCLKDGDCVAPACIKMSNPDADSCLCPKNADKCLTAKPLPAGDYFCKASADNLQYNNNSNCSLNTTCQLRCKTDADCQKVFEPGLPAAQSQVYCNTVVSPAGCMFKPQTQGCPPAEQLPAILKQTAAGPTPTSTALDWLRCNATVGANQETEALFEGGLRSAWQALDPVGNNCPRDAQGQPTGPCQFADFVRPDAHLAIVVISDDDDCSYNFALDPYFGDLATPSQKQQLAATLPKAFQRDCQGYNDRAAGNRFWLQALCAKAKLKCPLDCAAIADKSSPAFKACAAEAEANLQKIIAENAKGLARNYRVAAVSDFLLRFRSLKDDPAKVMFAAVTGTPHDSAGCDTDRYAVSYYAALWKNTAPSQSVYLCAGASGETGFGSRYLRLAQAFGCQGVVRNLCDIDADKAAEQWAQIAGDLIKAVR